jgi:hypothetical protein
MSTFLSLKGAWAGFSCCERHEAASVWTMSSLGSLYSPLQKLPNLLGKACRTLASG